MSGLTQAVCLDRAANATDTTALAVSERIRCRLIRSGRRFFANDNIADCLRDGELEALRDEVEGKLHAVLESLVIDTAHDHNSRDTARRVAKMFIDEVFAGRYQPAPAVTTFPNVAHLGELMTVGPIKVQSACAHHLCPIMGKVWIGVLPDPDTRLIGLSKYARIARWVMRRPQIQEEAIVMLADELEKRVAPAGLAVVMQATHFCVHWRGVHDDESVMRNVVMRGAFSRDDALRREFLDALDAGTH